MSMKDPIKNNKTNCDQISIQTLLSSNQFLVKIIWKLLIDFNFTVDYFEFQVNTIDSVDLFFCETYVDEGSDTKKQNKLRSDFNTNFTLQQSFCTTRLFEKNGVEKLVSVSYGFLCSS